MNTPTTQTTIETIGGLTSSDATAIVGEFNVGILQTTRLKGGALVYTDHLIAGDVDVDMSEIALADILRVAEESEITLSDDAHLALRLAYGRIGEQVDPENNAPHELESLFFYLDAQYARDADDEAAPALTETAIRDHIEAVQELPVWQETATIVIPWGAVQFLCEEHIDRLVEA